MSVAVASFDFIPMTLARGARLWGASPQRSAELMPLEPGVTALNQRRYGRHGDGLANRHGCDRGPISAGFDEPERTDPVNRPIAIRALAVLATSALLLTAAAWPAAAEEPDPPTIEQTDLVLLLDGSGSISAADWSLQLDGYAAALQDRVNVPLDDSVAVSVIQWSYVGSTTPGTRLEIPLTPIGSEQDVTDLVAQVRAITQIGSSTNPGDAIRAGTDQLLANGRDAAEWTLCMSTDGARNSGESMASATTYAKSSGVDRYSVVAVEDGSFTTPAAIAAYRPHVFGGGTVTVARTTAEFTSLISGCLTDPLHVEAIEVNQVIQDWDNSVPLVESRPTLVRVFLETQGSEPVRTNGRLHVYSGGVELSGSPLTSLNPSTGVLVDVNAIEDRSTMDDSLNFALPIDWTFEDSLELAIELPGGVTCAAEMMGVSAQCSETVGFGEGFTSDVEYRGISFEEDGEVVEPTMSDLWEQHERFIAQAPTAGWHAGFTNLTVDERPADLAGMNEKLQAAKELADAPKEQRWYGAIPGFDEGGTEGGLSTGGVASGFDANLEGEFDGGHARNRVVHELGHSYGLHHSVNAAENGWTKILWVFDDMKRGWCDEKADGAAQDYPYWTIKNNGDTVAALGPIGDPQSEIWGIDPRYRDSDEDLFLSAPQTNTSLMSYCRSDDQAGQARWIGKRDYLQLLTDDHAPIVGDLDVGTGDTIRGIIAADGQSAELMPALTVDFAPAADDPAGTHAVVLRDAAGVEVGRTRFTPVTSHGEPETGGDVAASPSIFNVVVPRSLAGAALVEVVSAEATLVSGTVSANAPQVAVSAPVAGSAERLTLTWSSSDADLDAVRHTVLYSADDGGTWNPIGMDLSGTSMSVARWSLPGSSTARIRVIASDGLRSTVATSAAFTLPNLAPTVEVHSPADGFIATGAQSIPLTATAADVEDGSLNGSVVWSSNLDGQLGTGSSLVQRADLLSVGTHRITATVTDSAGAAGSAGVTIVVKRVATPEPPTSDYVFGGFEPPVDAGDSVNAGRTIPVKWTVTGADVSDMTVVSGAFIDDGATYDMVRSGSTWHVNAATPKSWAGTTKTFRVVLDDLSTYEFDVVFR